MPDLPPNPPSLIQRRMALERGRVFSILMVALIAFMTVIQTVKLFDVGGASIWNWLAAAFWIVPLAASVVSLVKAVRAIGVFERENGRDAGKQKPVGRR